MSEKRRVRKDSGPPPPAAPAANGARGGAAADEAARLRSLVAKAVDTLDRAMDGEVSATAISAARAVLDRSRGRRGGAAAVGKVAGEGADRAGLGAEALRAIGRAKGGPR
jgi:hypothetical protein